MGRFGRIKAAAVVVLGVWVGGDMNVVPNFNYDYLISSSSFHPIWLKLVSSSFYHLTWLKLASSSSLVHHIHINIVI